MTTPMLEKCARAVHVEWVGSDPDELIHHPAQKSWEAPSEPRWSQWSDVVRAVLTALLEPDEGCLGAMAEWVDFDDRVLPEVELVQMRGALTRLVQHILKGEGNV